MSGQIKLLPNYFKKIGLSLLIITIFLAVILKLFHPDDLFNKQIMGTLTVDFLIIICCMIIFSRDKIEDEMTVLVRLKEFAGTFAMMVATLITRNIIDIATGENPKNYSATQLIFFMCSLHLTFHYVNLWKNKKQNNDKE
ncbi:hypothetical protein [Flavobacterium sp.]|uniref:hypothetical protein n=1 Tax=Flavobacterium sp. TaxID=239 RepID=UPI0026009EB2|nr:hypothetical protein [Flavobacterium sp.]